LASIVDHPRKNFGSEIFQQSERARPAEPASRTQSHPESGAHLETEQAEPPDALASGAGDSRALPALEICPETPLRREPSVVRRAAGWATLKRMGAIWLHALPHEMKSQ